MKKFKSHLLAGLLVGTSYLLWAAPIDVDITRFVQKFNLGIASFETSRGVSAADAESVRKTVIEDLEFSQLFNLVTRGPNVKNRKDAIQWAQLGSESVLVADVQGRSDRLDASVELFDVAAAKELFNTKTRLNASDPRYVGHEIANQIYNYFTGLPGIFTSKIAFINNNSGRKEMYIADYDAHNARRVTNDNSIIVLPRVSPNGELVIFTSYRTGNPDLYIMNTDGSNRRLLSSKAGINVSPSWSPNNKELAITLSHQGPPNIYLMDLSGRILRRLTDGRGADTAPSFSPDGNQISFTSDRAGAPHIYVINIDGSGLRRLTTEGHCDSSAWSPDGQRILYVKGGGRGRFDIYSIEVQTGIERRLTWGQGDNENPSWSPDGRFVLFISTRNKKSELFVMTADGSDQRPLASLKGESFTPHWGG